MSMEPQDKELSRVFWVCGKLVVLPWLLVFPFLWAKKVSFVGFGWADLHELPMCFFVGWWLLTAAFVLLVGAFGGIATDK
jgi:hypothetical protein